jgi:hypothetical protein
MITLASFERKIRRAAVAIGALLAGAFSFAHPAAATPLPLFPFFMAPPLQSEPAPYVQSPQMDDERSAIEQPARFRRQIVNYPTREAAGTIIVDTPNTYLYYVLGNGQALRYGIGVGRDGFTWSGVQTVTRKAEWPAWTPPAEMIARQPYLPRHMAGGPATRSAPAPCISAAPSIASTAPICRRPSARRSRRAASASPIRTCLICIPASQSAPRSSCCRWIAVQTAQAASVAKVGRGP